MKISWRRKIPQPPPPPDDDAEELLMPPEVVERLEDVVHRLESVFTQLVPLLEQVHGHAVDELDELKNSQAEITAIIEDAKNGTQSDDGG